MYGFMENLIKNKWYATKDESQLKVGQLLALNLLKDTDAQALIDLSDTCYA